MRALFILLCFGCCSVAYAQRSPPPNPIYQSASSGEVHRETTLYVYPETPWEPERYVYVVRDYPAQQASVPINPANIPPHSQPHVQAPRYAQAVQPRYAPSRYTNAFLPRPMSRVEAPIQTQKIYASTVQINPISRPVKAQRVKAQRVKAVRPRASIPNNTGGAAEAPVRAAPYVGDVSGLRGGPN